MPYGTFPKKRLKTKGEMLAAIIITTSSLDFKCRNKIRLDL